MTKISEFKAVLFQTRAILLVGVALFSWALHATPMTGYVGVLGAGQYQGLSEDAELSGGGRLEFTRMVKHISLDVRYSTGKSNYLGGALRFFQHWETDAGNHYTLGLGPGVTYAPSGNFQGNATQVGKKYFEYFAEGFLGYVWDFGNGVGVIMQVGSQIPIQRVYQDSDSSPTTESNFTFRPFVALGIAFDVD